jgi:hypothetical protein
MVLDNLYTTFLRIEALFAELYVQNAEKPEVDFYKIARDIYLEDINLVQSRIPRK